MTVEPGKSLSHTSDTSFGAATTVMLLFAALIALTLLNVISVTPPSLYDIISPTLKFDTQPGVPLVTTPPLVILNDLPVKSFLVSSNTSAAKVLPAAVDLTDFTSLISNLLMLVITLPFVSPLIIICSSFKNLPET